MKTITTKFLAVAAVTGLACGVSAQNSATPPASPTTGTGYTTTSGTSANRAAGSPSVLDQSNATDQEVEITRSIREELGKSDKLSTSAKNVEVITLNNTVTLRGAVATQAERQQVLNAAQRVAGNRAIRNEITVDTSRR